MRNKNTYLKTRGSGLMAAATEPTLVQPRLECQYPECPNEGAEKTARLACAYCTDTPYRHYCSTTCFKADAEEHKKDCQNWHGLEPAMVKINTFYFSCPRGEGFALKKLARGQLVEAMDPELGIWNPVKLVSDPEGAENKKVKVKLNGGKGNKVELDRGSIRPLRMHLLIRDTPGDDLITCSLCANTIGSETEEPAYYYCPDCADEASAYEQSDRVVAVPPVEYNCCYRCWIKEDIELVGEAAEKFVEVEPTEGEKEEEDADEASEQDEYANLIDRLYSIGNITLTRAQFEAWYDTTSIIQYESKPLPFTGGLEEEKLWYGRLAVDRSRTADEYFKFKCNFTPAPPEGRKTEYCLIHRDNLHTLLSSERAPQVDHGAAQFAVNHPSIKRHMEKLQQDIKEEVEAVQDAERDQELLEIERINIVYDVITQVQRRVDRRVHDDWLGSNDPQFTKRIMEQRERYISFQSKSEQKTWHKIGKNDEDAQLVSFIAFCLKQNWHETGRLALLDRLRNDYRRYWIQSVGQDDGGKLPKGFRRKGVNVRAITEYIEQSLEGGLMLAACAEETLATTATTATAKEDSAQQKVKKRLESLVQLAKISVEPQARAAGGASEGGASEGGASEGGALARRKRSRSPESDALAGDRKRLSEPDYVQPLRPEELAQKHEQARDRLLGEQVTSVTLAALNNFEDKYGHEFLNKSMDDSMRTRVKMYGKDPSQGIHNFIFIINKAVDIELSYPQVSNMIANIDAFLKTMPCFERRVIRGFADRRDRENYAYFRFVHYFLYNKKNKHIRSTLKAICLHASDSRKPAAQGGKEPDELSNLSRLELKDRKRRFLAKLKEMDKVMQSEKFKATELRPAAESLMRQLTDIDQKLSAMEEIAKRRIYRAMQEKQLIESTVRRKKAELGLANTARPATSKEQSDVRILIHEWQIHFSTKTAKKIYNQREMGDIKKALRGLVDLQRDFEKFNTAAAAVLVLEQDTVTGFEERGPDEEQTGQATAGQEAGGHATAGQEAGGHATAGQEAGGHATAGQEAGGQETDEEQGNMYRKITGLDGIEYFQNVVTDLLVEREDLPRDAQFQETDEQIGQKEDMDDQSWISHSRSSSTSTNFSSWVLVPEDVSKTLSADIIIGTKEQQYLDAQLETLKANDVFTALDAKVQALQADIEKGGAVSKEDLETLQRDKKFAEEKKEIARVRVEELTERENELLDALQDEEDAEAGSAVLARELALYESEDSDDGDAGAEAEAASNVAEMARGLADAQEAELRSQEVDDVLQTIIAQIAQNATEEEVASEGEEHEKKEEFSLSEYVPTMRVARLVLR